LENPIKQLFVKFILNRCSPQEIAEVKEMVSSGGYEQEWIEAMEETEKEFANADPQLLIINEQGIFDKVNTTIGAKGPFYNTKRIWIAAAAIVLLAMSIGLLLIKTEVDGPGLAEVNYKKTEVTKDTTHKWVKLPDGSSVQLNVDSYLEYPESFAGRARREVRLTGEAYFDIKHDAKHPFVIYTGKIKTTVLGTAFNINAYDVNESVTVTVTRGKVRVEDEKKVLAVLTPDQQLAWNVKLPEPIKVNVKAENVVEWKKHDLIMDDVSMENAAQMIADRYGVKIQFKNERVKNCRFTAAFLNRNDINQVLSVVGDITGSTLTLKDNLVTIDGPGC
jgi:transmembrane sensor